MTRCLASCGLLVLGVHMATEAGAQCATMDSIKENLKELEGEIIRELAVGPTGSFFDNKEVPAALRREIYALLADVDIENLYFETRCDTITYEKLNEIREYA